MKTVHKVVTSFLTAIFLMTANQAAESGSWPKKTQWGWQCANNAHCTGIIDADGPTACRKKVKNNEWSSKYKYCLKTLWEGAPCDNPEQCTSGSCDRGLCEGEKVHAVVAHTAEVQTKPSLENFNNLKKELSELREELAKLRESTKCNWNGHDRILIKPRDFFQISGGEIKVHTDYYNKGGAVQLHDNYDLLAQYFIPKNCNATEVAISLNQDCSGFFVLTSKLLHQKSDQIFESDINKKTKLITVASITKKLGLKNHQFTTIRVQIDPINPGSNVLSILIKDKDKEYNDSPLWQDILSQGLTKIVDEINNATQHDQDWCDVSGGYIKLEPVNE